MKQNKNRQKMKQIETEQKWNIYGIEYKQNKNEME